MSLIAALWALAFRPLIGAASELLGVPLGDRTAGQIADYLQSHFVDRSRKVTDALRRASDNAWRTLEVALAGESLWSKLARSEDKAFRQQVRLFLDAAKNNLPLPPAEFRARCLHELQAVRKAGLLQPGSKPPSLVGPVEELIRFHDPRQQLQTEWKVLEQVAHELRQQGYSSLAELLEMRPTQQGPHLLVLAVRYYFRREVENDPALFQGLVYEQIDALGKSLQAGFGGLHLAIAQQGDQLGRMLESLQEMVLDIHQELVRQGQRHRDLYEAVIHLHDKLDMHHREVRAQDSLSLRDEHERQLVRQMVNRYRSLPAEEQRQLPALLNGIGKLEMAVGDFTGAVQDFSTVSAAVKDSEARGEAHFNRYQALLEQRQYPEALAAMREALACAPQRFALFPVHDYEPEQILGAGGFGVAFLCRNKLTRGRVVVKSLLTTDLDRDVATVFAEAEALEQVQHPAIIRLRHCGFADSDRRSRPYLVMDYFEGLTLHDHISKMGKVAHGELFALVRPLAEALRAAHKQGILHRDVKPANVLVRLEGERGRVSAPSPGSRWQVKLIDFGLAMRPKSLQRSMSTGRLGNTLIGHSLAGTLDYAAPEQLGKIQAQVGPYSDVYGFARTCCYALFGTPSPLPTEWRRVPEDLADLLADCLQESPGERLHDFDQLLQRIEHMEPPIILPVLEKEKPAVAVPVKPFATAKAPPATEPDSVLELQSAEDSALPVRPAPPPLAIPVGRLQADPRHLQRLVQQEVDRRLEQERSREENYYHEPPPPHRRGGLPRVLSALLGAVFGVGMIYLAYLISPHVPDEEQRLMLIFGAVGGVLGLVGGAAVRGWGWLFILACAGGGVGLGLNLYRTDLNRTDGYYTRSGTFITSGSSGTYTPYAQPTNYSQAEQARYNQQRYAEYCLGFAWVGLMIGWLIAIPFKILLWFIRVVSGSGK